MRYLTGTPDFGLLHLANDNIAEFSDADWAGDHDDQPKINIWIRYDKWCCSQLE